jgi:hypothetical protein
MTTVFQEIISQFFSITNPFQEIYSAWREVPSKFVQLIKDDLKRVREDDSLIRDGPWNSPVFN